MKRETKIYRINDLIITLNEKRTRENKPTVSRQWTGLGHWLKTNEPNYKTIGRIYTDSNMMIGFIEGLLWTE